MKTSSRRKSFTVSQVTGGSVSVCVYSCAYVFVLFIHIFILICML